MNRKGKRTALRQFISVLLAVILVLVLVPELGVRAASVTVTINGKTINSSNANDIFGDGSMSYNSATNTLLIKGENQRDVTINSTGGLNIVVDGKSYVDGITKITAASDVIISCTSTDYTNTGCFQHQLIVNTKGKFISKMNRGLAGTGSEDIYQSKLDVTASGIKMETIKDQASIQSISCCEVNFNTTENVNVKGTRFGNMRFKLNCGGDATFEAFGKEAYFSLSSAYMKMNVKGNLKINTVDMAFNGIYAMVEAGTMDIRGKIVRTGDHNPAYCDGITKTTFTTTKGDMNLSIVNGLTTFKSLSSAGDIHIVRPNDGQGVGPCVAGDYTTTITARGGIYITNNGLGDPIYEDCEIAFTANDGVYIESKRKYLSKTYNCRFDVPNATALLYTKATDTSPVKTTRDIISVKNETNCEKISIINDVPEVDVYYKTHIQTFGWETSYRKNGQMSGTSGKAKRLEGINIYVAPKDKSKVSNLGIQYTTHCQTYGWLPWSSNNDMNGTEGEAKRLEAIKIQLTGLDKNLYDVYYRVHAQTYGWLGWAKNGAPAGTAGYAKRLEGIQIVVVKKGAAAPGVNYGGVNGTNTKYPLAYYAKAGTSPIVNQPATANENPVIPGTEQTNVAYRTHVQTYGWQGWKFNGQMSGTSGEAKRLESIQIRLSNKQYTGSICYTTHVQSIGWQNNLKDMSTWMKDGQLSGTFGQRKRLEAICIGLSGELANHYDIYYRVHAQSYGWLGWAKNGEPAGTAGYGKRLEGIQIVLVPKGGAAPANNYGGVVSTQGRAYISK